MMKLLMPSVSYQNKDSQITFFLHIHTSNKNQKKINKKKFKKLNKKITKGFPRL